MFVMLMITSFFVSCVFVVAYLHKIVLARISLSLGKHAEGRTITDSLRILSDFEDVCTSSAINSVPPPLMHSSSRLPVSLLSSPHSILVFLVPAAAVFPLFGAQHGMAQALSSTHTEQQNTARA
jgi:hypothetical protein